MTRLTYSTAADLLKGDMPMVARYGDGTKLVEIAADEIDAQIGHLYVTPFVIPDTPENRPSILLLKKINNFLASGRYILDMALGGEDNLLNAYGMSLVKEAMELLYKICEREIILTGAQFIPKEDVRKFSAAEIRNEDSNSLVEGFYRQFDGQHCRAYQPQIAPYDGKPDPNAALPSGGV